MAARRRANWCAVKLHRNYTVDEAARALGCCKGTIRRWIENGLPALVDRKPALILGGDLIDFLKARRKASRPCALDECYCLKCRAPRKAAGGVAELIDPTPTGGNLRANCKACGTLMHKRVSHGQLAALKNVLDFRAPTTELRAGSARTTDVGGVDDGATTPAVTGPREKIVAEAGHAKVGTGVSREATTSTPKGLSRALPE